MRLIRSAAMLLEMNQWHLGYSQLLSDARAPSQAAPSGGGGGGTVLILCGTDVDSLSAARILTYALRADGVPHQLRPCGGYGQLRRVLGRLGGKGGDGHGAKEADGHEDEGASGSGSVGSETAGTDVRAVVLLNIGAGRNLTRLYAPGGFDGAAAKDAAGNGLDQDLDLDLDLAEGGLEESGPGSDRGPPSPPLLPPTTRTYVLDSHRPYHLANVHSDRSVVLFSDRSWEDDVPSDGDDLSGDGMTTDEEDGSEDGGGEGGSEAGEDLGELDADGSDAEEEFDDGGEVRGEGGGGWDGRLKEEARDGMGGRGDPEYDADRDDDDDADDDDDDEDPFAEDGDVDGAAGPRTKRRRKGTGGTIDNDRADDDRTDGGAGQGRPASLSDLRRARRNRIRAYYASGSHHSSPVSWMTYNLLSTQLRYGSVGDLLWLACVGVTDSYLHGRIDKAGYATFAGDLRRHVRRVYPDDDIERAGSAAYAEHLDGTGLAGGTGAGTAAEPRTMLTLSENGRILAQSDEYRFFLLRHTTLWNAMMFSPYVCSRMELWKGSGQARWREMLARMGLPLDQCQQPYAFMKPSLKRRLREVVNEHAEEFGLDNLSYTGFVRITGYRSLLSASDMCHAVTALLECEAGGDQAEHDEEHRLRYGGEDGAIEKLAATSEDGREDARLMHTFNAAYDALGGSNAGTMEGSDQTNLVNGGTIVGGDGSGMVSGLGGGIRLALCLQKAIIQTAIGLTDRKAITRLSHFRYAYIHCTSRGRSGGGGFGPGSSFRPGSRAAENGDKSDQVQAHIFAKPLALARLASFLMDMHRANGKWTGAKSRPLVLLAEKPQADTYVVVGYEFPESSGDVVRNRFGQNFELAARTMNGSFKFDSFDTNVIEVRSADVQRFVEQLHYMMDSM